MGIFRKQQTPSDREPELAKLLDGYTATRRPSAEHQAVENILCWRCHRANVYDARLARPKSCSWCRAMI